MEALFQKYLDKAKEELRRGQVEQAQEAIESASFMQPEHVDVICCQVEILRARGAFEEAASCLQAALKLHPYRPWWVLELADLLINRLQEPALALDWLGRLLRCNQLTPNQQLRAFRLQVEALIDHDRLYEASLVLHRALSFFPLDLELLFLRGWVCLHRSNYYGAASAFHRILRRRPEHADAHYYLGLAFAALGELRLMRCHFEQAYALDQQEDVPLRFAPEEFAEIAEQVIRFEPFVRLPAVTLEVHPFPPPDVLEDIGFDPRRSGVLLRPEESSSPRQHLTLLLFQRNIERFCCSEREIFEELQQIMQREFAECMQMTSPFGEALLALSS